LFQLIMLLSRYLILLIQTKLILTTFHWIIIWTGFWSKQHQSLRNSMKISLNNGIMEIWAILILIMKMKKP
jgi:hypothetical protein